MPCITSLSPKWPSFAMERSRSSHDLSCRSLLCHFTSGLTFPSKVLCTLIYVVPFYLSSSTRPSPTLSRDAPSVIRARIRAVTTACIVCTLAIMALVMYKGNASLSEALKLLGWWPVGPAEIARSFLLTAILFAGPLFERGVAEGEWKDWIRGSRVAQTLGGWIGYRNYVAVSMDLPSGCSQLTSVYRAL